MKVQDHYTIRKVNTETGDVTFESGVREIELPDVITPEQAAENDRLQAIRDANAVIQAQLAAADLIIIRALTEGDTARITAHKASQAALRAKIKPVI